MPEHPATILFVDDDVSSRQTLSWWFRHAGYATLEAGNGGDALGLLPQKPDLVVLDVNLPDITGFEVCRRIKSAPATRSISVLQMSAVYVGSEDRTQGLEEGADAYLVKPVEPREVLATVKALLRVRAAEEAARMAAQEWRTTFDAISDAVCLLDVEGRICRCNRAMSELVGMGFTDLIGQPLADVLRCGLLRPVQSAECRVQSGKSLHSALCTLHSALTERSAERQSREVKLGERWFRVTSDPIHGEGGVPTGSVYILTDITLRKDLEEQLRQSQRLESIGRLAGGVAHHFNNILTAIVGNASVLMSRLPAETPEHEQAAAVERAAWRAAELTQQLLGFSRQAPLWLRRVDPGAIVEETAGSLRRTLDERIDLVVRLDTGLWLIQADSGRLGQALMNLCLNAVEAMPGGGRLTLTAGNEVVSAEHARKQVEARAGECVRIGVQDSGEGIPEEVLDHLFDPFSTTKPIGRGSGLGLAMVHGLVKQHDGWVECHSTPGEGTRFSLYLPRAKESAPTPTAIRARRILLADDDDTLRSLAAAYLRQGGFSVLPAGSVPEAIEVCRREQQPIDLAVLDRPDAEAIQQLRAIQPSMRVLEVGGAETSPEGAGVARPYRERELVEAVRRALGLS